MPNYNIEYSYTDKAIEMLPAINIVDARDQFEQFSKLEYPYLQNIKIESIEEVID